MAAPDDSTSQSGDPRPSAPQSDGSDDQRTLRQRIAGRWNSLHVRQAGFVIGGVAVAVAGIILIALSTPRATASSASDEEAEEDTDLLITRRWTNHSGGYFVCSHMGCAKKVDPTIFRHDCCGRCWPGQECRGAAQRDYDGPGHFAHNYFEVALRPGICEDCGEPPEAHHWVFDRHHGDRYRRAA
ncbi:hypothetical protein ABZS84_02240 [Streptomyces sp. NPDC005481]|uniref:hypothetical protein n=1 Tax=Streptomyces sp. NPDC005481 TaxID=3154881 RepID=UPI0033ABE745